MDWLAQINLTTALDLTMPDPDPSKMRLQYYVVRSIVGFHYVWFNDDTAFREAGFNDLQEALDHGRRKGWPLPEKITEI